MTFLEILSTLLIGPLKLIFELVFSVAYSTIGSYGLAIIILSLAMNFLALPLYRRADAIQIAARDTENKLKDVVAHIKKTFTSDERMMILQTYYRQNNYNPLSVLSGSVSLMLEIPFFMAAYQFLSKLEVLQGMGFGPIRDLSAPDGLLVIGSLTINVLPFLMTLINVISSSLYLKGFPLKSKIQLYGMALFFLIFLYNSPSALVFYWTLNNTFSLIKTLFYRIKNAKQVLKVLAGIAGAALILLKSNSKWCILIGVAMQLIWLLPLLGKLPIFGKKQAEPKPNVVAFVLGGLFLSVLVGLLIPSTYISASVQEYINFSYFYAPIWYIVRSFCLSTCFFLVWFGVFYWLANPKGKVFFTRLVWILSGIMLVNYMFFGTKLGVLSADLLYTEGFSFALQEQIINIVAILVLLGALYFLAVKFPRILPTVLLVGCIALSGMSVINVVKVVKTTDETQIQMESTTEQLPSFSLSKEGNNVVVIMLDRAIGPFVPYMVEENPELEDLLDGFTYYPNTLSYGAYTNFGAPALYGGYEYTPENLNLRSDELLVDKHNEALKVVPKLLAGEGYAVTVMDPSYANYQWIPDLSIYDDLDNVNIYHAEGKFNDLSSHAETVEARKRNFFLFSLMKTLPVSVQNMLYDGGQYLGIMAGNGTSEVSPGFMSSYNVIHNLSAITNITEGAGNTYMFLRSNMTHEPEILQEPDYTPASYVDNSAYYPSEGKTITAGESIYLLEDEEAIAHYHSNMAALLRLGEWFDYLRQEGVYDNTRIILAADHGRNLGIFDQDDDPEFLHDLVFYLPLLMVKDFGATGFTTSEEFMTNADVPALSLEGLVESPANPYTGNVIDNSAKTENSVQHVIISAKWDVNENNGTQFIASEWASVSGDVRNKDNWVFSGVESVLPLDLEN